MSPTPSERSPRRREPVVWGMLVAWLGAIVLSACGGEAGPLAGGRGDLASAPASRAFGIWSPGPGDSCTKDQHDAYSVVGPDGKRYPTWHPATGPGGCTFGHEHGRDPRESKLYRLIGDMPFGYVNEQLALVDPANPRDEDHVGHKVEWENDMEMQFGGAAGEFLSARCDVLTKLHQGTHSRDAFSNNVHELFYYIQCSDGTDMRVALLTSIGNPGEFRRSCDRNVTIQAGPAVPANSPRGGGFRAIPDRHCIEQHLLRPAGQTSDFHRALHETWETSNSIRSAEGKTLASFNPYFQVRAPSRYFDPALDTRTGRPLVHCQQAEADGRIARGTLCTASTDTGRVLTRRWDEAGSAFNGVRRFVDINSNKLTNAGGPTVWYTDPYGRNGRREPFAGSVRQFLAAIDNQIGPLSGGPVIGDRRDYGGPGVRAPN